MYIKRNFYFEIDYPQTMGVVGASMNFVLCGIQTGQGYTAITAQWNTNFRNLSCEIDPRPMPQKAFDSKSAVFQVIAWWQGSKLSGAEGQNAP